MKKKDYEKYPDEYLRNWLIGLKTASYLGAHDSLNKIEHTFQYLFTYNKDELIDELIRIFNLIDKAYQEDQKNK
jgi:hypothetical protein